MTLEPVQAVLRVLSDLHDADLLERFDVDSLMSQASIVAALKVSMDIEAGLADSADKAKAGGKPGKEKQSQKNNQKKEKKPAQVWLWQIAFDADSAAQLGSLWTDDVAQAATAVNGLDGVWMCSSSRHLMTVVQTDSVWKTTVRGIEVQGSICGSTVEITSPLHWKCSAKLDGKHILWNAGPTITGWTKQELPMGRPQLTPNHVYHTTLIFLGGASDDVIAARQKYLTDSQAVARLRAELASREGEEVEVEVKGMAWDDRIAAAEINLKHWRGLCSNFYPHVTVALADKIPPVMSNELLARKAAQLDLATGLGAWLSYLELSEYEQPLLDWCRTERISSPDGISARAADAAAAVESRNLQQRNRVEEKLAASTPGPLGMTSFAAPIRLRGRIHGQMR